MIESIDDHFLRQVGSWTETPPQAAPGGVDADLLAAYLTAQLQSRHLDFAARWLQEKGEGFYTIGSAGHESNAAVALALRPTDPALLHYRSGGFFAARASQVPGATPVADVLRGMTAAADDPISGGRHKVYGHPAYHVIPQTSTIASHLPRAVGLAFALPRAAAAGVTAPWPADAVVVTSLGDASVNHSTAAGALNTAAWCAHQGVPLPLLVVCEDNGIGISTRSPAGWIRLALSRFPAIEYLAADGADPEAVLTAARSAAETVRAERRPVILHLRTVRFMGHAGSDAELAYRSRAEIVADYARDPLLATARRMVARGLASPAGILHRYEAAREEVMSRARALVGAARLDSSAAVRRPIAYPPVAAAPAPATVDGLPAAGRTLAQALNDALTGVLAEHREAVVFGEDVAAKGGVYGVTRGLRKRFGATRVFDTLLDEQSILGTALGAALAGLLPIPEIQYLAYLHNAEDQLRGEAASLAFFSDGQYRNGMVVRIAGLAYQRGFGGHFHNDNSLAVLRDIPGLVLCVPSHPSDAAALLGSCVRLAREHGRVCVVVEPIALYHTRDLYEPGDNGWTGAPAPAVDCFGRARSHRDGTDLLIVTFGNGLPMSLRAADRLAGDGIDCAVLDLRWLAPLPEADILRAAAAFPRVLVVDETRRSGGVSEAVVTLLADHGYPGRVARVTSDDSYVPLGPAAGAVLLAESQIVDRARTLLAA
ncbi:thiamine pyrophosphate-dependent enzyme [Phytohabitans sp. ZYX-F-186]|uniref:Thiamine pyrophosphate-dependent enzyme n=1 Tax=Phytohabitans maris TaxID=3071409 RepID=A0ABU0ZP55_9ACTN|nr:thiamine pyrophosphate-dependent enzyme [Phytohabitans sp. ZYX-F-186]MDQ7908496.1 thiamine pyrophosphate-dependent enzyme [Phytohabitans sp. ZYX-F-186]